MMAVPRGDQKRQLVQRKSLSSTFASSLDSMAMKLPPRKIQFSL